VPELPPPDDQLRAIRDAVASLFKRLQALEQRLAGLEIALNLEEPESNLPEVEPASPEIEEPILPESRDRQSQKQGVNQPPSQVDEPPEVPETEIPLAEIVDEPPAGRSSPVEAPPMARAVGRPPISKSGWSETLRSNLKQRLPGEGELSWEELVGGRLLTWIGAIVLIIATAFAIAWAWQHFDTPVWLKVTAFHLLGVGLLVVGHLFDRRGLKVLAGGVAGLGIFTLYGIAFSALLHYKIFDQRVFFAECGVITLVAIAIALRANSPAIVLLGALGGYLTPLVAAAGSGDYVGWFVYLAFLNVALITCAVIRGWTPLKPLTWVATAAMFWMWFLDKQNFLTSYDERLWPTEWLVALHAVIFLVGSTLPPVVWRRPSTRWDISALVSGSMWFVGATWYLFHERADQQLALVSWGMAVLHLALFALTYRRVSNVDRMPRVQLALSAIFFTLAVPLQLDDPAYLSAAWSVEGLVFAVVSVYFRDRQMGISTLCVFSLAALRLTWDFALADPRFVEGTAINFQFLTIASCGLLAMASGMMFVYLPRLLERRVVDRFEQLSSGALLALGNFALLVGMIRQWDDRTLLVLWTFDAAIVWTLGFVLNLRIVRTYAMLVALVFAGGAATYFNVRLAESTTVVLNARFGSLALLAATFFVFGWLYRQLRSDHHAMAANVDGQIALIGEERELHLILGTLANVVLVAACCLEIHKWFVDVDWTAGELHRRVAEAAAYSVFGAVYVALLTGVGLALRYPFYRALAMIGAAVVLVKWLFVDLRLAPFALQLGDAAVDWRFLGGFLSASLIGTVAYGLSRRPAEELHTIGDDERPWLPLERPTALVLLAAANVVAMLSLACQWDGRLVLVMWTFDVAVVWAVGFWRDRPSVRNYAATLAIVMVGGRALWHVDDVSGSFRLIANDRFLSLLPVAILYFVFGWMYRRRRLAAPSVDGLAASDSTATPGQSGLRGMASWQKDGEAWLDPVLGVLGNLVLLTAISMDIHSWYATAALAGRQPFPDMQMAEQANYSIAWAVYAAVVVAIGFVMRYRLFRLLGLCGFAAILIKVFLVDLRQLDLLPRVLAFAALGLMLLAVSFLYQRFMRRIERQA